MTLKMHLVRLGAETDGKTHEICGLFYCATADLLQMIDEFCDPSGCEYAVIGAGGVFFPPNAPTCPQTVSEYVSPFENGADISEAWQWPVYDAQKDYRKPLVWMPVI